MMRNFNPFKIGLSEEMDTEYRRVTILTNAVYILMFFLLLPYLVYSFPDLFTNKPFTFREAIPWVAWVSSLFGFVLNALRKHLISKIFFVSSWIAFVTVLPVLTINIRPAAVFLHPFYCMVTTVIVQLVFSLEREKRLYYLFLSVVWLLLIFSFDFITYFNPDLDVAPFLENGSFRWRLVLLMLAAFFNGAIAYLIKLNHDFYAALQKQKDTVAEQNKILNCQRKDLEDLKLFLEDKVASRTQLLLEQNSKLREYTFFNSHILRAPVSRIRGLLYLLSLNTDHEEERKIRLLLDESMGELDYAIKSINDKLQAAELLEEFK
jgi:signal transduction histidine kinase